jgi:hypothetical protein
MRWLEDIPLELRLDIYDLLCVTTPVRVHNIEYPQKCEYLNDETRRKRIASGIKLMLTCRAVMAEFEPIFLRRTAFDAHFVQYTSCFQYCLPGNEKFTPVYFFGRQESRPLDKYFGPSNIQALLHSSYTLQKDPGTLTPSYMKHTHDRFIISEPLGCHRYPVYRADQAARLVRLLHYCRGRVRELEFWWHPVRWRPAEVAIPWRVTVDTELNFTIHGPTKKGFDALRKKFSKALWEYWPRRGWDRRCVGSVRRATAERPRPKFTFVEDHENTKSDHTAKCSIGTQKRYELDCNCGLPGHYGGVTEVDGTEGK